MSQCLLCGSCCAQCPNKVPTDEIVAAVRRRIAEQKGLSSFGKGVAAVLGRPKLMNALAKTGGALSSLLFKNCRRRAACACVFPPPTWKPTAPCRRSPPAPSASACPR
jgi:glycolate oxidase iron-sulfur subunit